MKIIKKKRWNEILREELILNKPKNIKKMAMYADKWRVKDKVKHIKNLHVAKVLGSYDNASDIDYEVLPNRFVMKVNHYSGDTKIIKDKTKMNKDDIKKHFNALLKKNYAIDGCCNEHHYGLIQPKLFIEEYLGDNIKDYKFFCMNGKVVFIQVDTDRFKGHKRALYTIDWKKLNVKFIYNNDVDVEKPAELHNMIKICETLSKPFKFVRVDLYQINDKIYFGELTFTPEGLPTGTMKIKPDSFNYLLGYFLQTGKIDYNKINEYIVKENYIDKSKDLWKPLNNDRIRNKTINNIPSYPLPAAIKKADDKIILVTYADDRGKRKCGKYKTTMKKVSNALKSHPDIKYILPFTETHLFSTPLYKHYKSIYDNGDLTRGGSGLSFKPYFILQILPEIDDGSFVLWHDSSPEIWDFNMNYNTRRLTNLTRLCTQNKGILIREGVSITNRNNTNKECLSIMNLEHLKDANQGCASWIIIQKNDYTMKLIKEWLYWLLFPDCAATYQTKNNKKVNPNFGINLGDQSVLDLLIQREHLKKIARKDHDPVLGHRKNIFSHLNNTF